MTIGVDLSPLQGPHRMRGIGAVLYNFINHLSDKDKKEHSFVFFVLPLAAANIDPLEQLELNGINYEVRELTPRQSIRKHLPGKLNLIVASLHYLQGLRDLRLGDSRLQKHSLQGLDAYLQVDPVNPLPKSRRKLNKVLLLHDLIPYVLEWDYLWSYKTFRQHGRSRKTALKGQLRRLSYLSKTKVAAKRANTLLTNSQTTKHDAVRYLSIKPKRIIVTHLGVNQPDRSIDRKPPTTVYRSTAWGYLPTERPFDTTTPFIFFAGGADPRRKLKDLVTAYNMLRAQGIKLQLVFAGDCMQGPMNISTIETQHALKNSSYLDDIVFLGFADKTSLDWAFSNALAFVFPSRYEGFGLPVLEAMSYGTPVIAYNNSATREVAADIPIYVNDALGIKNAIEALLLSSKTKRAELQNRSKTQAEKFTWEKTTKNILKATVR